MAVSRALGWMLLILAATALALFLGRRGPQEPEKFEPTADEASASGPAEAEIPERLERRFRGVVKNMWWHQDEMRDALELRDEQVAEMDDICLRFLRSRWLRRRADEREENAFAEALAVQDLAAADEALKSRERRAAEGAAASDRLTLSVLRILTPEQLAVAHRERPQLFRQPWLRSFSGSPARAGREGLGRGPVVKGRAAAGDERGETSGSPTTSSENPPGG